MVRLELDFSVGHGPSRPQRGPRCGCRRGSRCATNAQPPRAPKGHRTRRCQSGQPFGLRAPRATRSIPGASPHGHGERRVLRFECRDTLRLAAVLQPMGAPRAAPWDGGVRHWWTYPRDAAATFACLDFSALVTGGRARAGRAPAEKGTPTHRPATAGRGPACPAGAVVPAATECRVGRRRRAAAPCSGPLPHTYPGLGAHAASLAAQRRAGARLHGGRSREVGAVSARDVGGLAGQWRAGARAVVHGVPVGVRHGHMPLLPWGYPPPFWVTLG